VKTMSNARLDAPAFHRNHAPIWSVLAPYLQERQGDVLELGSGSGQHLVEFARQAPHITWWPSDLDAASLHSIAAWREHAQLANLQPPLRIDIAQANWSAENGKLPPFLAILSFNVIHIAPWQVAQGLFTGVAQHLRGDGRLFLYGPFMREGKHTAPSNAAFDASLRRQNPQWGVRDLRDVAALAGRCRLALADIVEMPANNLTLVFERSGGICGEAGNTEVIAR
jgi:SAM-dependent methyltransferase